jgi:hypothetical protein
MAATLDGVVEQGGVVINFRIGVHIGDAMVRGGDPSATGFTFCRAIGISRR